MPMNVIWDMSTRSMQIPQLKFVISREHQRDSARWNAPEEESVYTTNANQILHKLDNIIFFNGAIIRCSLTKEQLKLIKAKFDDYLLQDIWRVFVIFKIVVHILVKCVDFAMFSLLSF